MGEGGARAALLGTEGGSAAVLGIELSPGGQPETPAETARCQRGLGHRQGQGHRGQSPLCQAGMQTDPWHHSNTAWKCHPVWEPHLVQGGEGDRVTQLQRGTSSCVSLPALVLFQRPELSRPWLHTKALPANPSGSRGKPAGR